MQIEEEIKNEERLAIDELRKRMKDEMEEDLYNDINLFHRFLSARDFNVENAEDMLRKHLEWRKKHDVKNIFNYKMPEVVEKYFVYVSLGYDKEGYKIKYAPVGNIDFIGILSSVKTDDVVKILIHELESESRCMKEQSVKLNKNIDKLIIIADLKNLSLAQVTNKRSFSYLKMLLHLYINNYPQMLKAAFVLNAPIYFSIPYTLMKAILPSVVLQKIRVYSDDSYKNDLLELADGEQLPAFLGGKQTDPDGNPLCLTKIKRVEERVPEEYFIQRNKRTLSKLPGVEKVTLPRAAFHEVKLDVKEPGSYIEWEFETKCRDIGFGLFYNVVVDGEVKTTELVPIQRIETEDYPETGTLLCEDSGTYVIVFDNTYSWIRAKEIYYRVKIVSPEEHEAELKEK